MQAHRAVFRLRGELAGLFSISEQPELPLPASQLTANAVLAQGWNSAADLRCPPQLHDISVAGPNLSLILTHT